MNELKQSLRETPVVSRGDYEYFVHGVTDGIPPLNPDILREVAAGLIEVLGEDRIRDIDKIVAPEAMGIHHGTALSLETDIPLVVIRKREYGFPDEIPVHQETAYGESELYINGLEAGDRVVIVDDVLSSGSTIKAVCAGLEEADVDVLECLVVLRRVDMDPEELPLEVQSLLDVRVEDGEVVIVE